MWPEFVVSVAPFCYQYPCLLDRCKPMLVQKLVTELIVEALNERILCWFPWIYQDMRYLVCICPAKERFTGKFRTIIRTDCFRITVNLCYQFQDLYNALTAKRCIYFDCQRFLRVFVNERVRFELSAVHEPVFYEIHCPNFVWCGCWRHFYPYRRPFLPS